MLCVGFDLLHVSVGQSGCGRSGVVVGKSGIEGGEAFTVNASCFCVRNGKKSSPGTEIGGRVKQLFGREIQKGGVFAVHLEQPDADGDMRTILDLLNGGDVPNATLRQAIREGLRRELIRRSEIAEARRHLAGSKHLRTFFTW